MRHGLREVRGHARRRRHRVLPRRGDRALALGTLAAAVGAAALPMADQIEFTPTPADLARASRELRRGNWGRYERLRLMLAGASIVLLVYFLLASYAWRIH